MKSLTMFLTHDCSNRCRFCCDSVSGQAGQADERCRMARRRGATRLVLIGGEPGMHPQLVDVVRLGRERGFEVVQLITNGAALENPVRTRELAGAGLGGAGLSIHGATPDVHDCLTQRTGAFLGVQAALRNAADNGLWITTNTVVTRQNIDQLDDIMAFVLPWTAIRMQLAILNPAGSLRGSLAEMAVGPHVAAPAICQTIGLARDGGLLCTAEALPLCLMPGLEAHAAEATLPELLVADGRCQDERLRRFEWRRDKGHAPRCTRCVLRDECAGTYPLYFDLYPDLSEALRPVAAGEGS